MKYALNQKFWSLGGKYEIKNEENEIVYRVVGKAFSFGDKLSFRHEDGTELAYIEQLLLSDLPTYRLTRDGAHFAEVRKKGFNYNNVKFRIDVEGGTGELIARGDFTNHEYSFTRDERVVALVSKEWFSWSDSYGIDLREPAEDPVLILAAAVVIDLVCHNVPGS